MDAPNYEAVPNQSAIAWHNAQVDPLENAHVLQRNFTAAERRLAEQLARIDPVSVDPRVLAACGVARRQADTDS